MSSFEYYSLAKRLLLSGYRVLTFDLYGSGKSDHSVVATDADLFIEQLLELLEVLEINNPVTLCGFSMGALISMAVAAKNPNAVSRLILISPGGFAPDVKDVQCVPSFFMLNLLKSPLGPSIIVMMKRVVFLATILLPFLQNRLLLAADVVSRWDHFFFKSYATISGLLDLSSRVGFQMHADELHFEYLLSLARNFPFYGEIDDKIFSRLSNHPKKILVIWGQKGET